MNIVHYGGFFVNLTITSKEEILKAGRKIAQEKGLDAINMRSVAAECNIALGTLYNYYANKDELVLAVIESIWKDIFHIKECKDDISFLDFVVFILSCLKDSKEKYPNFFVSHSMILEKWDLQMKKLNILVGAICSIWRKKNEIHKTNELQGIYRIFAYP